MLMNVEKKDTVAPQEGRDHAVLDRKGRRPHFQEKL